MSFSTTLSSQQCFTTLSYVKPPKSPSLEQLSPTQPSRPSLTPGRLLSQPQTELRAITNKSSFRTNALPGNACSCVQDYLAHSVVQEIVRTGKGVPEGYLVDNITPAVDETGVWKEKLLLDISVMSSGDTSSPVVKKELAKLRSALSEWGCFQIINHGIDIDFLNDTNTLTKQFFSLPFEEKAKLYLPYDLYNGYGNTHVVPEDKRLNWSDRYILTLHPEEQRNLNVWLTNPPECRGMLEELTEKLKVLQEQVFKAMARCLGLDETRFLDMHGRNGRIVTRFAYYPPCPRADKVFGAHPHSDPSTFSILLPDEQVDGLQVLKDKKWVKVPTIPGALYVNAGDFLEVMSNGIFKSVVHRAVTNSKSERATVNNFFNPEASNDIEPVKELVDAQHPKSYKKVNLQSYMELFYPQYVEGKRVIDALKT